MYLLMILTNINVLDIIALEMPLSQVDELDENI